LLLPESINGCSLHSGSLKMKKQQAFNIIKQFVQTHEVKDRRLSNEDWHELWHIITDLSHKVAVKTDEFGVECKYVSHLKRQSLRKTFREYAIILIEKKGGGKIGRRT